jgi:hypothetical protein
MDTIRRLHLVTIAAICGLSVVLQLYLSLTGRNLDHSLAYRAADVLSYFTVTTNILVAAVALAALARPQSFLARPSVMTATAIYIFVVGVTYAVLLKGLVKLTGLHVVADVGLHEATPVLFVLYWLLFTPKAELKWRQPVGWLIYPLAYIAYTLARGAMIRRYPYPFADVAALGYPKALANAVLFVAAFLLLGLITVAWGRLDGRMVLFRFDRRRAT